MLKDEPDDLTHLAPVAGDVCVPLLEDGPFLNDMLMDDFLLRDNNFCPLLTDDPPDPFLTYRDSCDPSPQLLSPNLSKVCRCFQRSHGDAHWWCFFQNSECSLPSLNSPSESLGDEDQMSSFMSLQMDEDSDLAMKAPYIPMNNCEDLPLLMSPDLMWNTSDRNKTNSRNSSLAQLLCSSVNKQMKESDHGGGLLPTDQILNDMYTEKSKSSPTDSNSQITLHFRSHKLEFKHRQAYSSSTRTNRAFLKQ